MSAAVKITDLTKFYGSFPALQGVSFEVPRGTVFGLLGPNGAGKTTLFSMAAGFIRPSRGSVEVLGVDVTRMSDLRGKLSILPQDALFQANIPILEQMIFFCRLSGSSRVEAEREAMAALDIVGLADAARKNARILSHGMNKRLGIAQALLGNPEVILLDEPTAGLDPFNAQQVREIIYNRRGKATLVVSSHNLAEIQQMCSHVAILDHGKLLECNTVASITQAGKHVRMTFARQPFPHELDLARGVEGVTDITPESAVDITLHLNLVGGRTQDQVITEVVQRLAGVGLIPRAIQEGTTLEAKFLQVTGARTASPPGSYPPPPPPPQMPR